MLDEKAKERVRTLVVEIVLEVRRAYLASPSSNVLKHWDQLHGRMKAAARTTASPEEWASRFASGMRVRASSSSGSRALIDLVHFVREHDANREFFEMLDREHDYMMALARLSAEARTEERKKADEDAAI